MLLVCSCRWVCARLPGTVVAGRLGLAATPGSGGAGCAAVERLAADRELGSAPLYGSGVAAACSPVCNGSRAQGGAAAAVVLLEHR